MVGGGAVMQLSDEQARRLDELDITVQAEGDRLLFRLDVPELEGVEPHDAVWAEYLNLADELGSIALAIADPCLEHDCVSGALVAVR